MSTIIIDAKLYGLFFLISLDFNFPAVKINEYAGKNNLKALKNGVCGTL